MTKIIGLTGGIATGKSFVGSCFAQEGVPVLDVDKEVHRLLDVGGEAEKAVSEAFPGCVVEGKVHRGLLGEAVFSEEGKLKELEAILHPLVRQKEESFINTCKNQKHAYAVIEVTLLYQTGADKLCDYVIMTRVDEKTQKDRARQREGMTEEKLSAILERQSSMKDYIDKVEIVIDTGTPKQEIEKVIKKFLGKA